VAIGSKFLRTSEVPQMFDMKDKMTNLVNYSFFALSKFSKNPEAAQAFLAFLSTPGAQEKFLKNFAYYLPAQTAFESDRLSQSMNKMFERAQYQSFLRDGVNLSSFDK
jgi:spermidine/putrescine-binding protein